MGEEIVRQGHSSIPHIFSRVTNRKINEDQHEDEHEGIGDHHVAKRVKLEIGLAAHEGAPV